MSKQIQMINGVLTGVDNVSDIASFYPGTPTASAIVMKIKPARTLVLPINLTLSVADAEVAATGSTVFSIKKNGSSIGSITFGVGASAGTFTFSSEETLIGGTDKLTIVAPVSPDLTLADISITLAATR